MRVVVDTNVFVSAAMSSDGPSRQIIRLCLEGSLVPLMGNTLLAEFEDVLSREDLFEDRPIKPVERDELLRAFTASCVWVHIYFLWRPNLRDEADNHLVELALAGGAAFIITANTRDFRNADLAFPKLGIASPKEFLTGERK